MTWSPFKDDPEVIERNDAEVETERVEIAQQMDAIADELALYDSDEFTFFRTYLQQWQERTRNELVGMTGSDPTDLALRHAAAKERYMVLSHLLAVPDIKRLEYDRLKEQYQEMRPADADNL